MSQRTIRREYAKQRRERKQKLQKEEYLSKRNNDLCSASFPGGTKDLTPYNTVRLIMGEDENNIVLR